ncbi:MAG: hypothetical protein M1825_002414 [Sarcosagium campestre]|nr:MAG: hypothetical protein M1825_002414 [Sarcosagium campestre]
MATLDADLLALAGDSSDEEEAPRQTSTMTKSASPAVQRSSSPTGNQERDAGSRPGVARRRSSKAARPASQGLKRSRREDSEEEGEASSARSSPSLDSASMSESETESNVDITGSATLVSRFPLEGKFISEADKATILALPEIKREEILAERATEMEREQQNRMLIRLLRDKERKEGKMRKKRSPDEAELDDNQRKSSRRKTTLGGRKVGESSAPLELYKKQREQRGHQHEQRKRDDIRAAALKKNEKGSDGDDAGSDVSWDDAKAAAQSSSAVKNELPPVLKDFNRARVGRTGFGQVCCWPGFEQAITNCFTRISIGPDPETGENKYRLCTIKGFTNGKPYAIEGANGKKFVTTLYVVAKYGKAEKEWPFIMCSDQDFTEAEFVRFKKVCEFENVPVATKSFLDRKVDDINKLLNRSWTPQEIQEKLERSGVLANRNKPFERRDIKRRRERAIDEGDEAAIAKCDAELAALEGPKLAFGTSLYDEPAKEPEGPTQQERLAALNHANRKANTQDVRKAQLAERRAERLNQAAIARGEAVPNPFARVKTRAKVMYDVNAPMLKPPVPSSAAPAGDATEGGRAGSSNPSRGATPLSLTGANTPKNGQPAKRSGTPLAQSTSKGGANGWLSKPVYEDDILASAEFDFGIDIDNL